MFFFAIAGNDLWSVLKICPLIGNQVMKPFTFLKSSFFIWGYLVSTSVSTLDRGPLCILEGVLPRVPLVRCLTLAHYSDAVLFCPLDSVSNSQPSPHVPGVTDHEI